MASCLTFWDALGRFQKLQSEQFGEIFSKAVSSNQETQDPNLRERCISSIEAIMEGVVQSLVDRDAPVLRVPKKHTSGDVTRTSEDFVSAGNPKTTRRFAHLLDLLSKSHSLLQKNKFATRRDLYYENVPLYEKQSNLDKSLEDAARMLGVPRRALHVTATGKGLIAGHLTYVTHDGTRVQVAEAHQGVMIPECVSGVSLGASEARFILVVEKDATFQKLLEAHILRTLGPCILVTGKGYPDLCTRQMVHRLWTELRIPVLALVDADPYGLHIAAIYKFGAIARDEPHLRVNGLALLGILPSELGGLQLPQKALIPLTPRDHGKIASLEAHPSLKGETSWLEQIKCLREFGMKAEIQSLTHISPDFLSTIYLPTKISSGAWIT